jgi:hypothetical protein
MIVEYIIRGDNVHSKTRIKFKIVGDELVINGCWLIVAGMVLPVALKACI